METNKLEYSNKYAVHFFGIEENGAYSIFDFVSKATAIFYESYIIPTLISSGECMEIQISLIGEHSRKMPAVANIQKIDSKLYWSIYTANERDKLYQELLAARSHLENKSAELLALTRTDPLTTLLNRRAAISDLNSIIQKLKRVFVPVSFLLIDIDWFKAVNDKYGHSHGDDILKQLSSLLDETTRSCDVVARWGGEEFLVVLYNSDSDNTDKFCHRLHRQTASIKISQHQNLSVSIGVSELTSRDLQHDLLIDAVIKRADAALYQAKEAGRNQTKFWIQK
jgi:diguanylate cyclase (GGDEF)-like protein